MEYKSVISTRYQSRWMLPQRGFLFPPSDCSPLCHDKGEKDSRNIFFSIISFTLRILRVIYTLSIVTTSIIFLFWLSGGEQEKTPKYSSFKQPQILKGLDTGDFLRETHGRGQSVICGSVHKWHDLLIHLYNLLMILLFYGLVLNL